MKQINVSDYRLYSDTACWLNVPGITVNIYVQQLLKSRWREYECQTMEKS